MNQAVLKRTEAKDVPGRQNIRSGNAPCEPKLQRFLSAVSGMQRGLGAFVATLAGFSLLVGLPLVAEAQGSEVNVYTARHYQADEALYEGFTAKTGIKVNLLEGKSDALIARLVNEGVNSPADVFMTVDAGSLWRAETAGLFQQAESAVLRERIPEQLRHPDGLWFGFSKRARFIYYAKDRVKPSEINKYSDLSDPKWKGRVCIRSSSNIYNLSLLGSIIAHDGEEAAEDWAKGVVANFAQDPSGGDTDQIRNVAAGVCDVAVANSYYYIRLLSSDKPEDRAVAEAVGVVFPNQDGRGTHVNISGAGVVKGARHPEAAVKLLEYLASDGAQRIFADGNNEYPAVPGIEAKPALQNLGNFKEDPINVSQLGQNQPLAQKIFDRAGWK